MLLPPQTTRMKFQPSLYPQTHTDFSGWAAFSIVEIPQFWMTSVQNIPHTGVRPLRETDLWVTGWRKYKLFTLKEGWAYRFWWSTRFDWEVGLGWSLPLPQTFSFIAVRSLHFWPCWMQWQNSDFHSTGNSAKLFKKYYIFDDSSLEVISVVRPKVCTSLCLWCQAAVKRLGIRQ